MLLLNVLLLITATKGTVDMYKTWYFGWFSGKQIVSAKLILVITIVVISIDLLGCIIKFIHLQLLPRQSVPESNIEGATERGKLQLFGCTVFAV